MKIPAQYREAVEKSADTAGLPIGIIAAQINQESGWNPKAVSPVGARGIAQFMPETWKEWGNGKDPFDPFAGLDARGRYMKYLAGFLVDLRGNDAYGQARRRRAKPRTLADTPSLLAGAYAGYFFLGILLVNCLRFWEAAQVEEVVAKILVTFISCMFLVAKMQAAYNMARLEDGNDQVV